MAALASRCAPLSASRCLFNWKISRLTGLIFVNAIRRGMNVHYDNFFLGLCLSLVLIALATSNWRIRSRVYSRLAKLPKAENDIRVEKLVRIPTPDGIMLAGDLYRPNDDGSYPTIIIRTPYGRNFAAKGEAEYFSRCGYNVLMHDVRGAGDSGGVFTPLSNEKRDGVATVGWVTDQPWFNGEIVLYGMSYLGYTATAIAV